MDFTSTGWPAGADVAVYLPNPFNLPAGASIATETADETGSVTFTGLDAGTRYLAIADTDAGERASFTTDAAAEASDGGALVPALIFSLGAPAGPFDDETVDNALVSQQLALPASPGDGWLIRAYVSGGVTPGAADGTATIRVAVAGGSVGDAIADLSVDTGCVTTLGAFAQVALVGADEEIALTATFEGVGADGNMVDNAEATVEFFPYTLVS